MIARASAVALALAMLVPAGAAHSGAQLLLSAVVAKNAQVAVRDHPASIQVSEADITRGYVDIASGPRIEVSTNSREGLLVSFLASGEAVRSVHLRGAAGDSILLPGPSRGVAKHRIEPGYRLILAPAARPGTYAWPVQVIATPL
jgi:hypothetical protein